MLDVREAMQASAPCCMRLEDQIPRQETDKVSNVATHTQFKLGDVEKGFQEADVVIEREFTTATVHQGYIEPHNATAMWNPDGQLTIWESTQGAFTVQRQLAPSAWHCSGADPRHQRRSAADLGQNQPMPRACRGDCPRKRTVKVLMNRAEVFESTGPTPGSYIRVKMGATKDGRVTAAQAYMAYEAGGYPGSPIGAGMMCIFSRMTSRTS